MVTIARRGVLRLGVGLASGFVVRRVAALVAPTGGTRATVAGDIRVTAAGDTRVTG